MPMATNMWLPHPRANFRHLIRMWWEYSGGCAARNRVEAAWCRLLRCWGSWNVWQKGSWGTEPSTTLWEWQQEKKWKRNRVSTVSYYTTRKIHCIWSHTHRYIYIYMYIRIYIYIHIYIYTYPYIYFYIHISYIVILYAYRSAIFSKHFVPGTAAKRSRNHWGEVAASAGDGTSQLVTFVNGRSSGSNRWRYHNVPYFGPYFVGISPEI